MFQLIYRKYGRGIRWKDDLLAGLTVALALVPEAVAFAFVAGVDPLVGLYAAFLVGLITASIGGRPGMISGATGAMAVAMTALVTLYGLQYLLAAVILAGVIQILTGILKLGRFIRILPHPVMLGFVNGLAIVIGLAQFGQFKTNHRVVYEKADGHGGGGFQVAGDWFGWGSSELWIMIGMLVATMLIIQLLPKLTRAVPAPLVAIVIGTLAVSLTPLTTTTVGDVLEKQRVLQAERELEVAVVREAQGVADGGEQTPADHLGEEHARDKGGERVGPANGLRGERVLLERRGRVDRVLGVYRTPSGPTKGFVAVRVPSSSSPVGSGTGGSGGFRMGAHILGPGPASTAQARSSLSLSQSLCARCSSLAGTSFSVSGLSGRGSTSICGVRAPPGAAVPRNLTIISSISAGSKSPAMLTSRGPDLSCASTAATTPSRVSLESSSRLGSISRLSPNTAWFTLSWVRSSRLRWVLSSNMR